MPQKFNIEIYKIGIVGEFTLTDEQIKLIEEETKDLNLQRKSRGENGELTVYGYIFEMSQVQGCTA